MKYKELPIKFQKIIIENHKDFYEENELEIPTDAEIIEEIEKADSDYIIEVVLPTYFYQEDNYPYDIIDFEYETEESIKELEIDSIL